MVRWIFVFLLVTRATLAIDMGAEVQAFANFVADKKTDGLIVAISYEGKDYFFPFGYADRQAKIAPTPKTIWEIGSITKSVTGLLFSQLILDKKIPADGMLKDFIPVSLHNPKIGGIMLAQLATHTSGLPRMPSNFVDTDDHNPYYHYQTLDLYRYLADYDLQEERVDKFDYSNLGMGVLGHVLSLHSKMPYEDLVQDNVLKPLGMKSTLFYPKLSEFRGIAQGYHQGEPVPLWRFDVLVGIGALKASSEDMLKYMKAQAGLAATSLRTAMDMSQEPRKPAGPNMMAGYGWMIQEVPNQPKIVWHNGGTHGFGTFAGFVKGKAAVFVAANSDNAREMDTLAMQLLMRLGSR